MAAQRDLFISHSSGDVEAARELRGILEDAGYSVWLAPEDIVGTEPWAEQILAAIDSSRAMLVLVSASANRSPHVSREVSLAHGRHRAVVPIRIEQIAPTGSLEYHLEGLQRIDAYPLPLSSHRERILRRLGLIVPLESAAKVEPSAVQADDGSTDTEVVPVPVASALTGASATPAQPAGSIRATRPRWLPISTGLSAALVTIVAVMVLGTGVLVFGPTGGTPSVAPSGTAGAVVSNGPSLAPTVSPTDTPVPSPSPTPDAAASATLEPTAAPDPDPTRTPRPASEPDPPDPTPKVTKKPTPPPTPTPSPTPTPVPATKPAKIDSHTNGGTIHGTSELFAWTAATGPKAARYYSLYIGSNPPGDPCPSGYCQEPGDDAFAHSDVAAAGGLSPSDLAVQIDSLPADGSTIYVRLFTKYQPESGTLTWRDYTFTSAP